MNHGSPDPDVPGPVHRRPWGRLTSPLGLLFVAMAVSAILTMALAELRFLELTTTTWDLGIYQQSLFSAAHGHPFYEAPDVETGGPASFLQVHSSFVLYALVPLYAIAPTALTLFAVQSLVVAAAALPLFLLTRSLTGSDRRALALGILYLAGAPIISSSLYDFHAEAFVPIALFSVAYLWQTRRYAWGMVAAVLGFLSLEVVPVMLFALAVFFLSLGWTALRPSDVAAVRGPMEWGRRAVRLLTDRTYRPTWVLLVACVLAYYLLLALRLHLLADWFGFPPYPMHAYGYVIGGDPGSLGLSLSNVGTGFYQKMSYWIALFVFVGFLPLWFRRTLLLVAPWFAFTVLTGFLNFSVLGFQYGFVAAAPLYLGGAWALSRFTWPSWTPSATVAPSPSSQVRWRRMGRVRPTTAAVLLLVGLNLMFTPLDPLLSNAAPGAAFNISLAAPVSLDDVQHLLALVPADAIVLASYDLFPLVANDVNAYTMFWTQNPNLELPFNLSHPPEFVVVSENRLYTVPPWLTDTLYVSSVFGVRAVAWTSPVGPVVLFEHGFAGAPISWGSGPTFPRQLVPRDLALTSSVKLVPNASAPGGSIALSVDGATGELLQTYGLDFGNGTYRVTFWVLALRWDRSVSVDPREMVFAGDGVPFAQPSAFRLSADYATLNGSVYVPVTANFTVTEPIFDLAIQAFSADPNIGLKIQAIDVERLA